jgi:sugar phosphate permease
MDTRKNGFFYGWIIVVVTFLVLLGSAGVRNATGVLILPLEKDFGWTRSDISSAFAISLVIFGLGGALGGMLVERWGARRVMTSGLLLTAAALFGVTQMKDIWQFHLWWGLVGGVGTGILTNVLGSAIAGAWFNQHRNLVVGVFSASSAAGQLLFSPLLIALAASSGWQGVMNALLIVIGAALLPTLVLMRSRPQDVGASPYGEAQVATISTDTRKTSLRDAIRTRDFWLLAGSFFICGYTTNGMIGTHLLPHTLEHGFVQSEVSWALGIMGLMNIVGTMASGWLSERYDNRRLLAIYYSFRALALIALPFILEMKGMLLFSVIYGLDWVATVPPTVNITAQRFGRASVGTLYGWIFFSHMVGAALASYAGARFHDQLGDYQVIFLSAALMGFVAMGLSLSIGDVRKTQIQHIEVAPASASGN